jgi:hypothetical protein
MQVGHHRIPHLLASTSMQLYRISHCYSNSSNLRTNRMAPISLISGHLQLNLPLMPGSQASMLLEVFSLTCHPDLRNPSSHRQILPLKQGQTLLDLILMEVGALIKTTRHLPLKHLLLSNHKLIQASGPSIQPATKLPHPFKTKMLPQLVKVLLNSGPSWQSNNKPATHSSLQAPRLRRVKYLR